MKLYHCMSARSFRPLWMLEELGLPYELVMLPFPPRARSPGFLDENPLGTIPLLVDGATRMTESAAICQYLAARAGATPLQVLPEEADYGAYLNGLHFGESTLTFPLAIALRYSRLEPPERRQPAVAEDYARWFGARLRGLEATMSTRDYFCGGRFTAADVSVGYALMLAEFLGLDARFKPAVADYWLRLRQREGFRRALSAQDKAAVSQGVPLTPAPAG